MLSSIFLWANSEVLWRIVSSFHYYVGSMFSCSRWTIPTGISSPLQRKHPWEKRLGTDVWNPLTSALSAGHLPSLLLWFTNRTTAYIETELAPHCEQGVTPASQLEHHTAESQQGRTGHGTPVQACVTVTHHTLHIVPPTRHSCLVVSEIYWVVGVGTAQEFYRHLGPSKLKSSCLRH